MGEDRFPALPLDSGGGGEGGGAGGAGGGSWTVVGLGGGTPEEPDGDPRVGNTGPVVVDRFNDRTIAPPTITSGASVGSFAVAGQTRATRYFNLGPWLFNPEQDDVAYADAPFAWIGGRSDDISAGNGQWLPWTHIPSWATGCGNQFGYWGYVGVGYFESEQWFKLTVPAHPAGQAGITFEAACTSGSGYGAVAGMQVMVASAQPTTMHSGTLIGHLVAGGTTTFTIPSTLVPAEGGELWVGYRAGWTSSRETAPFAYFCGFPSHAGAQAYDLDSTGDPYQGYTGSLQWATPASPTWQTYTSGSDDFGATIADEDGVTHTWEPVEQSGSPTYGIDTEGLYVEATAPSTKAVALTGPGTELDIDVVDDDDEGFWSAYEGFRIDVAWEMDAVGLTGQSGTRSLQIEAEAEGQHVIATAHLGDGTRAAGVSADGGNGSEYVAKSLSADTRYVLAMDIRSTALRAKLWADTGPFSEPATWDVEVPIAYAVSAGDSVLLRFAVGNVISSQRVTVRSVTAYASGRDGDIVVGELIGTADGITRTFPTAHQYEASSIVASANGILVRPSVETPASATFAVDQFPTTGSIMRCRYVIAGPDNDED